MRTPIWLAIRQSSSRKLLLILLLFSLATVIGSAAQEYTLVANFVGNNGYLPIAGLTKGADGNFYGTTFDGGTGNGSSSCSMTQGCGTVFKVTPTGTLTSLYSFCSQPNCTDGSYPYGGLALGADGNLYGVTEGGGTGCTGGNGCGTAYKITPTGTLTILHSFCAGTCQDGDGPSTAMLLANDGNFYGVVYLGGPHGSGTVFRMTPDGTVTTMYSFCSITGCLDGAQPAGTLIQAADGNLYGTTAAGGTSGNGTVFRISLTGTLSTLHSFDGTDGSDPMAGLVQARDGNFYGTTQNGGQDNCQPSGCGTIFRITPTGAFTLLYSFSGTDGANPDAGLLQAADGNLYGSATSGGLGCQSANCGTLFAITTSGTFTKLYNFNFFDGASPRGTLLQAGDGGLYGTVGAGGHSGNYAGSVFRLGLPQQFVAVPPCRLVDTRQTGDPIEGGTVRNFNLAQLGGCGIPASAAAYSLNVTVAPHGPLHYLTIWPQGDAQPTVSTLNSLDGRVKANAAIVPSVNNSVSVYATDTTDVILDIDGYFLPPGSQTLQFYPLTPCRLVDTRQPDGPLGGPRLEAQQERDFPLLMSSCIPSNVIPVAYSLNVTAVPNPRHQPLGYLTLWPAGEPQPDVSTLNNPTGTTVANATITAAGQNGELAVYPYDSTDLLIDINGYFAAPAIGGYSFYPVPPCRAYDTRTFTQPFSGEVMVDITYSLCLPPGNATGFVFNATVLPHPTLGYLTLWPAGQPQPVVSTLNAYDGSITSNMAIVPTQNCCIDAYAGEGTTHLILDMSGFFAP